MSIILFARDPGAANMISAVLPALPSGVTLYAKDYARDLFGRENIAFIDFNRQISDKNLAPSDAEAVESWLSQLKNSGDRFCMITGTTNLEDFTDRLIWEAAATKGITTISILDQWYRAKERFVTAAGVYRPDYILAPTKELAELLNAEGLARKEALHFGHPYLEKVFTFYSSLVNNRDILRQKLADHFHQKFSVVVVLASDPQRYLSAQGLQHKDVTYDEFDLYNAAAQGFRESNLSDELFIVKLHPKEKRSDWSHINANILCDEFTPYELIVACDIVIGTKSMMLLEALLLGKIAISVNLWNVASERLPSHDAGLSQEVTSLAGLKEALNECRPSDTIPSDYKQRLGIEADWAAIIKKLTAL
ncbi:MAG: hypothetical protein J5J00_11070 [Deltaproteobacteria bacterium]|nr:hypothetical protein [Deltaproteobacteria bacterium]